jgi:hypothetical protein
LAPVPVGRTGGLAVGCGVLQLARLALRLARWRQAVITATLAGLIGVSTAAWSAPTPSSITCRLPVVGHYGDFRAVGGFVSLPDGTFEEDPDSRVRLGSDEQGYVVDPQAGNFNLDRPKPIYAPLAGRWLPAESRAISPDGALFAVAQANAIRVFDAETGASRDVGTDGTWFQVEDFGDGVLYASAASTGTRPTSLWAVDTTGAGTPSRRLHVGGEYWRGDGRGRLWALGRPEGTSTGWEVRSLAPRNGTLLVWPQPALPQGYIIMGFDGRGWPLLDANGEAWPGDPSARMVLRVSDEGVATTIAPWQAWATGDGDRVWLARAEDHTLWTYRDGEGLHSIASLPLQAFFVAGPCT